MMFDIVEHMEPGTVAVERKRAAAARRRNEAHLGEPQLPRIEPGIPALFVYDGTLEGLATALYASYAARIEPDEVVRAEFVQPRFGQQVVDIVTDFDAALRVRRTLLNTCGQAVWNAIALAAAADDPEAGTAVFRFARYALARRAEGGCRRCGRRASCTVPCSHPPTGGILDEWADASVEPVLALDRRVCAEAEKMRQFVRFQEASDGLWYARCNPNANVVPLIMAHFAARLNTQRFVIYDEAHHVAGLSEHGRWEIVSSDDITMPVPALDEPLMQDAWRRFYQALSVEARYNPELRRHFMPVRLWKNLTEMQTSA